MSAYPSSKGELGQNSKSASVAFQEAHGAYSEAAAVAFQGAHGAYSEAAAVAFQGAHGAYSEAAAFAHFGPQIQNSPLRVLRGRLRIGRKRARRLRHAPYRELPRRLDPPQL